MLHILETCFLRDCLCIGFGLALMTLGWRWPGAASAMPGRSSFGLSLLVQLALSQLRASVLFGMILSLGHSVCFFALALVIAL